MVTTTPTHRTPEARRALDNRIAAARTLLRDPVESEEALSILDAVVLPMNEFGEYQPLLGLDWSTSSATAPS